MTFILSKILWIILRPSHLLLFCAIGGITLQAISPRRLGYWLTSIGVIGLLIAGTLPIGNWLMVPLEARYARPAKLPERVDGIIVLGGAQAVNVSNMRDRLALNENAERLIESMALALQYPTAKLVFSGHSASLIEFGGSEADVNWRFVELMQLERDRIIMEERSRNTFENAIYSQELLAPKHGETWILVTSAYHMPRSMGIFTKIGWDITPWPVDYRSTGEYEIVPQLVISDRLFQLDYAAKEWVGLIAYYIMGRTNALLPPLKD